MTSEPVPEVVTVYHFRFHAHFRELVDTFTDVHKAQRQFFEVSSDVRYMTHDFRGVHRGTAAQRDDSRPAWKELAASALLPCAQRSESGRLQLKKTSVSTPAAFSTEDLVCIAVAEQEAVSHDERTFGTISNHFIQRDGQRATAEADRFRKFVPQHVFSSLSNGFLVDQGVSTNCFRDGVTTP